jgi:hypothetical protein
MEDPEHIGFEDPDAVIDIETVGNRAGGPLRLLSGCGVFILFINCEW